jgi:hypothetical protein
MCKGRGFGRPRRNVSAHKVQPRRDRCGHEKPDHRHRRLLSTRRQRPRGTRAAEQGDEIASSHVPLAAHSDCFTEPWDAARYAFGYPALPHAYCFT